MCHAFKPPNCHSCPWWGKGDSRDRECNKTPRQEAYKEVQERKHNNTKMEGELTFIPCLQMTKVKTVNYLALYTTTVLGFQPTLIFLQALILLKWPNIGLNWVLRIVVSSSWPGNMIQSWVSLFFIFTLLSKYIKMNGFDTCIYTLLGLKDPVIPWSLKVM